MKNTMRLLPLLSAVYNRSLFAQSFYRPKAKALLAKMTLEEKIRKLNFVTHSASILTGADVSHGVKDKIENGLLGGLFSICRPEKLRSAQVLFMTYSRRKSINVWIECYAWAPNNCSRTAGLSAHCNGQSH
jgi:hypothetical protein